MKIQPVLLILLLTAALTVTASAEEAVFISTGSAHYGFSSDEEAQIPVKITNTLGKDLPGTLVLKVKDPNTGEYSSSQRKQVTAFSGEETYYVSAGSSGENRDLLIDISFEYGNSPVYSSELNGIGISFASSPDEDNSDSPLNSEPVKGTSGIKAESQEKPSYSPGESSGEIRAEEEYSDSSALKKTLMEEEIEREFRKNAIVRAAYNDTLLNGINSSLYEQNFSKTSFAANPKGENSGCFYSAYINGNEKTVSVSGTVDEGEVKNILEKTNATITLPQDFLKNATLAGIITETEAEGFERADTEVNISLYGSPAVHSELKLTYKKGIYAAEIHAVSEDGTVISVTLEKDDIVPFWVMPILLLIFASANAIAVYVYYSVITEYPGNIHRETPAPDDLSRREPDLLKDAERLFMQGYKKEAVSMAVRALRRNISYKFSSGEEISDRECRDCLLSAGQTGIGESVTRIIKSTEEQRFSETGITEEEFKNLLNEIKSAVAEQKTGITADKRNNKISGPKDD
ncbi:hypothetical protein [Methanoplanus limicola]|uniref:DUF4129 domain-containing protein n=1 Tax=Methanoplanus limicola DSM 2279 TaxID=937775 RepID=H1YY16_9EURY|nr:hypothetical protein [Methanoplanus limicola]EHQ36951.1 hypothetical protein Metlim_2918 [Methanoplanus limicola DSM 2279]